MVSSEARPGSRPSHTIVGVAAVLSRDETGPSGGGTVQVDGGRLVGSGAAGGAFPGAFAKPVTAPAAAAPNAQCAP